MNNWWRASYVGGGASIEHGVRLNVNLDLIQVAWKPTNRDDTKNYDTLEDW